jgi:hypothetical protein
MAAQTAALSRCAGAAAPGIEVFDTLGATQWSNVHDRSFERQA